VPSQYFAIAASSLKRPLTNPLSASSGKRKKKASEDKIEEVRSQGSYQQKKLDTELLCKVETKLSYSKTESYDIFKPCREVNIVLYSIVEG